MTKLLVLTTLAFLGAGGLCTGDERAASPNITPASTDTAKTLSRPDGNGGSVASGAIASPLPPSTLTSSPLERRQSCRLSISRKRKSSITRSCSRRPKSASPTPALLTEIATWLVANFDLPPTDALPRVEFASPGQIAAIHYRGLLDGPRQFAAGSEPISVGGGDIVAVYDTKNSNDLPAGAMARNDAGRGIAARSRDGSSSTNPRADQVRVHGRARKGRLRGAGALAQTVWRLACKRVRTR